MPNTLAHLGVQTLATRATIRGADVRWIFIGAIIPDVPWIAGRATVALLGERHDHDLWAYYIAQSSLAVSLLLCGAVAVLTAKPRRVFGILALNALLHLVLDGLQTRWGNGVHLLAPFSWEHWNAGWFGIDSPVAMALTLCGAIVASVVIWRNRTRRGVLELTRRRVAWAAAFLIAYLALPVLPRDRIFDSRHHAIGVLRDSSSRAGRRVELDRTAYRVRDGEHFIYTYGGDVLRVENGPLRSDGIVSVRATFVDDTTITIERYDEHTGSPRDTLNYVGLALVVVAWLVPRREQQPIPNGGQAA